MISSRTRISTGSVSTVSSNAPASWPVNPSITSCGSPVSSPAGTRAEKTSPTDSIPSRRATKVRTWAEARSSHCVSSTTQTRGRSSAASASTLRTARPTRNRSGTGPSCSPKVIRSALRCGAGSSSSSSSIGAHSWCSAANASSISDWTAVTLMTRQSAARWVRYSSSAVLPTPASPRITRQRLSPRRSASRRESSSRRSASRPMSRVALRSDEECADLGCITGC